VSYENPYHYMLTHDLLSLWLSDSLSESVNVTVSVTVWVSVIESQSQCELLSVTQTVSDTDWAESVTLTVSIN